MAEHSKKSNERSEHKAVLIAASIGSYLLTAGLIFFLFNAFGVTPIASAALALAAGAFVVFILLGVTGTLREFSVKSPLFELTSVLRDKIDYVKEDLTESKKEISKRISTLNENIQSINNAINTIVKSQSMSESKSDAHLTSQINNNLGEVVKEVRQLTMDMLSIKLKDVGYKEENPSFQREIDNTTKREERLGYILQELPTNSGSDVDDYINKALLKNLEGKYDEAVRLYDQILKNDPDNVIAMTNKGNSLNNLGKYEEAIRCLDRALAIHPNFHAAKINKGNALLLLKRYEEAIRYYDDVLRFNPNLAVALNNKAKALVALGKNKEANEFIQKAIAINPNLAVAWGNMPKD